MERDFNKALAAVAEEAERQQQMARRELEKLDAAVDLLRQTALTLEEGAAERVHAAVGRIQSSAKEELIGPVQNAGRAANDAASKFHSAARWSIWRLALIGLGVAACGIAGMVATAWTILPSYEELVALRAERAQLVETIDALRDKGGRAIVGKCTVKKGSTKPCVQVDMSAGRFEDDYYLIKGY
jgi:hypothetical protein